MARGTAAGERVISQAGTETFRSEYDRIFGERAPKRGRWVQDPETGELVDAESYAPPERAIDAPICAGRFYENVPSPLGDGKVFASRSDYNGYLREKGLTPTADYDKPGGEWDRAEARRQNGLAASPESRRDRQERLGRHLYEVEKMPQAKYDKQVREVERRRRERGPGIPTE
jgi:hypothetical protein